MSSTPGGYGPTRSPHDVTGHGGGLGLRKRPQLMEATDLLEGIRTRCATRWTQQDRLSVGETSASNCLLQCSVGEVSGPRRLREAC